MPGDSTKSVVYRSLFFCNDPKGVARCKTARRSKTGFQKSEDGMTNEEKVNKLNVSISYNQPSKKTASKLPTNELHNPSSIHLRETSRGARKLNQVIGNWSKGISFDRKSKDIAEDLLRGALNLKESLDMFGKLQEASHYMAKLKRKQKEKGGGGRKVDPAGNKRSSHQFGYEVPKMESQKPKVSIDGSPKDCYEELRQAITEGLAKQNLLPKSSNEDKAYFYRTEDYTGGKDYLDKKKDFTEEKSYFDKTKSYGEEKSYFHRTASDISMEFPSTSSDQSSMFHSREFDTSDSSFQWSFEEKAKGPNEIARLMGLQEHPPKSSSFTPEKQLGREKSSNYARPILDMELPKPRMPQFSVQKADAQQRTLEEMIQTVQFQGLVASPSHERLERQKPSVRLSDWTKSTADDSPPIVIIKPLHSTWSLGEDIHKQKLISQDLDTKEIIRKLKMKEMVSSRTSNVQKGVLNINELQRKLQGEMSSLEIICQEEGDKHYIDASIGAGDRVINRKEKLSSTKAKASDPVTTKVRLKEVADDKVDKVEKSATITRKPTEGDPLKISDAGKLRKTNNIASSSTKKPESEPNVAKDQISQLKATAPSVEFVPLSAPDSHSTQKKKAKPEKLVSISASTPPVETKSTNVPTQTGPRYKHEHDLSDVKTTTSGEIPAGDETNNASRNIDDWKECGSNLSESTSLVKQKTDAKSTDKSSDKKASNASRVLLLDNPVFLNNVAKMFYTDAYRPLPSGTTSSQDHGSSADSELLLDCSKELLENKSHQCTRAAHRFSHITNKSKDFIFLDQLLDEVCDGIEELKSYHALSGEKLARDRLPKMLHKDLWSKGVISGGWDLGWRSGFTPDEVEEIVINIEQEILNEIIENTVADMMN